MRKPDNNLAPQIELYIGASGTGKSTITKERIARERQVLVFDVKNEYGDLPGFKTTYRKDEFLRLARQGGRIAFAAHPSEFDFYCRVVFALGSCLNIVEELGACTGVAKATGAWFLITSQGRGFGIRTMAMAQRTAEVDKTIVGNLSRIQLRRQVYEDDMKTGAKMLGVPFDQVQSLKGFEFIERDMRSGDVRDSRRPENPFAQKLVVQRSLPLAKPPKKTGHKKPRRVKAPI